MEWTGYFQNNYKMKNVNIYRYELSFTEVGTILTSSFEEIAQISTLKCILFLFTENLGNGDPDLFEGDMILTAEQRAAAEAGQDVDAPVSRGSINKGMWRGGIMYYTIDSSLRKSHMHAAVIKF